MKNEKVTNKTFNCIAAIIAVILATIISCGITWIVTCGFIKLITLCFGLTFKWKIATGIWLIIYLLDLLRSRFKIKFNFKR